MNRLIVIAGLVGTLSLPVLFAPASASASCSDRKLTGTVLGGVGGALIGNAIAGGTAATVLGGLGGAVVGHEIAGSGCRRSRPTAYYRSGGAAAPSRAVRYVYYDQYGNPVSAGPLPAAPAATAVAYAPACRTETQPFYDDRGALVQRAFQVCAR